MDIAQRIYDGYAGFYDALFHRIMTHRIARAIKALDLRPEEHILDVGIGTGLSLPFYPPEARIVGLDLSGKMLAQAAKKIRERAPSHGSWPRRIRLIQADALALPFGSGVFDAVLMSHVISTVPDPFQAMREALRVCRDHGRIVLVNHFAGSSAMVGCLETTFDPLCRRFGWRSTLTLAELLTPFGITDFTPAQGRFFQILLLNKHANRLDLLPIPQDPTTIPATPASVNEG